MVSKYFLLIYFQRITAFEGNQFLSCTVPFYNKIFLCMLLTSIGTFEKHIYHQKALKSLSIKPYYIENFQSCDTVSDDVNNQINKSSLSLEVQQQEQGEIKKAKLVCQLKEIRQQFYTVFNATKQQLV